MEKVLAKVLNARLDMDRGIMAFRIEVEYEDVGCQVIGKVLDTYVAEGRRIGTESGCEMIRRLLLLFRVNDFSEMKGKNVWVFVDDSGSINSRKPLGFQSLAVDGKVKELIFSLLSEV